MHVKSHTNVAFDWTYHFLTCEKTLFAILIGRVFFFHMWKTLFAPLISKNQLAHENVQCSFSQYIYNKQLWKIFTRTYRQNDHQYPSVLFYTKWITWISGMTLQHFFYSHHYGVKAKISCMSQCPLISPPYQFSVHRHKKWSVCSGVMDSWQQGETDTKTKNKTYSLVQLNTCDFQINGSHILMILHKFTTTFMLLILYETFR